MSDKQEYQIMVTVSDIKIIIDKSVNQNVGESKSFDVDSSIIGEHFHEQQENKPQQLRGEKQVQLNQKINEEFHDSSQKMYYAMLANGENPPSTNVMRQARYKQLNKLSEKEQQAL
ncbi:unnamed protein product [Brachionus calyciflorus]|uniref:Uncharacterized protein n=1 Tax=Brachionus calyciflorus TaxID=104777 RepID=A0A814MFV5_9BILA|nr:unnamed protein product [Brachionus calyciflorus]